MNKYKYSLIFILSICTFGYARAQNANVEAYVQKYKSLAISEMVRTGVPAAISLAQGIIESNAGAGWLAVHANNQFGIKCKSDWKGMTILHNDDRRNECFRKYASETASWKDHSDFLKKYQRYQFLFYLDPLDYKAWAYGLTKAGYATNKRYATQLIQTIQNYKLEQYSRQGILLAKNEGRSGAITSRPKQSQQTTTANEGKTSFNASTYPKGVFKINNRQVMYLAKGTQLISIAEAHGIPLRRLVRYNELKSDVLPRDMLIYLQKKRKKGVHTFHRIRTGESLHQIAQEEGIRMKWLRKRNHLSKTAIPNPRDRLVLRGFAVPSASGQIESEAGLFHWLDHLFSPSAKK